MSNAFLTPSVFAQEGLMILENELVLGNKVRVDYSDEFGRIGDTLNIRRPTMYAGQADNLDITSAKEDITQGKMTLTMNKTHSIAVDIGSIDRTLSFDRVVEDVIRPAMVTMKDEIEQSLAAQYYKLYGFSGTPGTVPAAYLTLATAGAYMTEDGIPLDRRFGAHTPIAAATLADALKGVLAQPIVTDAIRDVSIGRTANMTHYECVHAPTHTVGVATGTPRVNGATQNVTYAASKDTWSQSLVTDGWTNSQTGILKAGDVFTIAGVNGVNPVSKVSTGRAQTFTVLADANSGASTGPATLTISPPIITSGAYQTVTAAPADDALITVKTGTGGTSYKQSLLLHPDCLMLATRPLYVAESAGVKTAVKTGNRVSIRVTEGVNINTLAHTMRFDMLWGVACDPRLGHRLTN
jgi:hypothetical protein